ncbi:MAG: amino acid--tRNA ligase-related protein [Oscillospiraceae bacterium]|nr:amino acid--tRNA ligase-related protein [Oscillospiraceae bacterium]
MNDILSHLSDRDVKNNLIMKRKIRKAAVKFLDDSGFDEYDTPLLIPSSGEIYNPVFGVDIDSQGAFLADSPQLCKMMLSFSGFKRYYQFAHCFRPVAHEKNRETRLCEFMQLDIEMQVSSLAQLTSFAEKMLREIFTYLDLNVSVSRMEGHDCRNIWGSEMKPDLRTSDIKTSAVIIEHMPLTNGEKTSSGTLIPCHHIFALPSLSITSTSEKNLINMTTESFDIVVNGIEVGGGDLRITDRTLQENVMDIFDADKSRCLWYLDVLDEYRGAQTGGFAIGLERLIMALSGCSDIRKTAAFPDLYMRGR